MTTEQIILVLCGGVLAYLVYVVGQAVGRAAQRKLWSAHMAKGNAYIYAVDDLDRWCGHHSPHARLIARHLKALGEGLGCNAGTPFADEVCNVSGLREQLKRLDALATVEAKKP